MLGRAHLRLSSLLALVVAALVASQPALAADSLLDKILGLNSGPFGIIIQVVIILVSIFMIGWAINCFINITQDKIAPQEMVAHLQGYIEEGDLEGALQYCEAAPSFLTRCIAAPLQRMHSGPEAMAAAAEQQLFVESGKLNKFISPLSLVSAVGPMLGLFGTVAGMVAAFDTMATEGANLNPSMVAGSIGLALMSTVMGLIVAIPGMVFFWLFSNRVTTITDNLGLVIDEMVDQLRGYAKQA